MTVAMTLCSIMY